MEEKVSASLFWLKLQLQFQLKKLPSVSMFFLASDIDGLNRRNEPEKISMSKKAEAFEIISQKFHLKSIRAFRAL